MRCISTVASVLIALAAAFPSLAEEITLKDALETWRFLKGDWKATLHDGKVDEVSVRLATSGNAYVYQSPLVLNVLGWDAKSKRLEVQSYAHDGARGISYYDRKSPREIVGKTTVFGADGSTVEADVTFTILSDDAVDVTIGDKKIMYRRR
jgi:hypothetical protein